MDQSASEVAVVAAYGSSSIASPSFNRPQQVRFTSVHTPKKLGILEDCELILDGVIGAESGSQTLFFSFDTQTYSRITLRKLPINRYTDQYISIFLHGEATAIPLEEDPSSLVPILEEPAAPEVLGYGYVLCGYWVKGYCEDDCLEVDDTPRPPSPSDFAYSACDLWVTGYADYDCSGDTVLSVRSGYVSCGLWDTGYAIDDCYQDTSVPEQVSPTEGLVSRASLPGGYWIVISSSEWAQLPYSVQLTIREPGALVGVSTCGAASVGALRFIGLSGSARTRSASFGRLAGVTELSGVATTRSHPTGALTRVSPYPV